MVAILSRPQYVNSAEAAAGIFWKKLGHHHGNWCPGPRLNINTIFSRYGDSHVKDKTVARPSYL